MRFFIALFGLGAASCAYGSAVAGDRSAAVQDAPSLVAREASKASISLNPRPTQPPGAVELISWIENAIPQFFPNHTGWQVGYNKYFDKSLVASFAAAGQDNYANTYNFATFETVFTEAQLALATKLSNFQVQIIDAVAYPFPNDTRGGYLYLTGLEFGTYLNGTPATAARDGVYATVKDFSGTRRITEWREASDFNP